MSPETFVRIWQTSESLSDVARRTRFAKTALNKKAAALRDKGVPLRYFGSSLAGRRPTIDYEALANLARKLAPKETT